MLASGFPRGGAWETELPGEGECRHTDAVLRAVKKENGMTRAIVAAVLVIGGLAGLLVYSQQRHVAARVSGYIEADEIRLGSRVGGRVKEVRVHEGESIAVDQLLVRLEEYDLDERAAQAKAEWDGRVAEWNRLVAGFRDEEKAQGAARVERIQQKLNALVEGPRPEEIAAARARQKLAQAQLDLAKTTYDRNVALYERDRGAVTREALDRSAEELKAAEATREVRDQELLLLEHGTRAEDIAAARAELAEAKQALALLENGSRPEDIQQARAAAAAAEAAYSVIQAQRQELEIRSPVAGTVEAVELQPGDLVGAGTPILSIMDTSRMWVRAYVPESRTGLRIGQKMRVTVDAYPEQAFEGTLTYVSRQAEFTPRNVQTPEERSQQVFRVKVQLPAAQGLRPGMTADVWLDS